MTRLPQPFHRWAFYRWTAYRRWYNKRSFAELKASARALSDAFARSTVRIRIVSDDLYRLAVDTGTLSSLPYDPDPTGLDQHTEGAQE